LDDFVAQCSEESADLAIAPLSQFQFDGAVTVVCRDEVGAFRLEQFALVFHALGESLELAFIDSPLDDRQILLADPVPGVSEVEAEFSVVGEEKESLAVLIQPSYGEQIAPLAGKQVEDRPSLFRVASGAEEAAGLVEDDVDLAPGPYNASIDGNFSACCIHLGAQGLDHLTVDGDVSADNQLFSRTAGRDPGFGEELL
jgi:hypothetical protein